MLSPDQDVKDCYCMQIHYFVFLYDVEENDNSPLVLCTTVICTYELYINSLSTVDQFIFRFASTLVK
jgi:hypothetical protein